MSVLTVLEVFCVVLFVVVLIETKMIISLKEDMQYTIIGADQRVQEAEQKKQSEIKEIIHAADERISDVLKQADQRVRETEERIIGQREILVTKSEKDLMVDVAIALDTYSARLSRIETKCSSLNARLDDLSLDVERALDREVKRSTKPFVYTEGVSQDVFEAIVDKCIKGNRVKAYADTHGVVHATVESISGQSAWKFTLDFNSYGNITGNYTYTTENTQSNLPTQIGDAIKKEILFRLN